jgi:RecG-like helicase
MPVSTSSDVTLDREQAWQLYAVFCGDVERTAHALGLRPVDVLKMAESEGWQDKLKPIIELTQSSRPGDIERGINRALNFVQAHRMRLFVERIVTKLSGLTQEEIEEYLFTDHKPKDGEKFKRLATRALADLASAMEKAHALTYLALGDTAQDRNRRGEGTESGGHSASELHAQIAQAFAAKRGTPDTTRALLFDAQLSIAETQVKQAPKLADPYNDDSH